MPIISKLHSYTRSLHGLWVVNRLFSFIFHFVCTICWTNSWCWKLAYFPMGWLTFSCKYGMLILQRHWHKGRSYANLYRPILSCISSTSCSSYVPPFCSLHAFIGDMSMPTFSKLLRSVGTANQTHVPFPIQPQHHPTLPYPTLLPGKI